MGIYNLNTSIATQAKRVQGESTTTSVSVTATATSLADTTSLTDGATINIHNAGTATIFIDFKATVTTSVYRVSLPAGFHYEQSEPYKGRIFGITASGTATTLVSVSPTTWS